MNTSPIFYKCETCVFGTKSLTFENRSTNRKKKPRKRPLRNVFNCANIVEPYRCKNCNFETNTKTHQLSSEYLEEIERTSTTPSKTDSIFCENCKLRTSSILVFLGHRCRRVSRQPAAKPFECDQCSYKGKLKHHLLIHKTVKHPGWDRQRWYVCARFRTRIDADWRVAPRRADEWYECDQCPYRGRQRHHLNIHKTLKHPESHMRMYGCSFCPFLTRVKADLNDHVASEHATRGEWFKCDQCRFKALTKANLQYHGRLTHSGLVGGSRVIGVRTGEGGSRT